jgi:hypothetical protein
MTDERLDQAIDRAARELMNVDADAQFRARVLARVERDAPRRSPWVRNLWLATASAAVVLGVVLLKPPAADVPQSGPIRQPTTPVASTTGAPTPADKALSSQDARRTLATPVTRGSRTARAAVPRPRAIRPLVAAVAEGSPGVDIAPLEAIEPISMAPLGPQSIAPTEIVIAALTPIAAVEVTPFSPQIRQE